MTLTRSGKVYLLGILLCLALFVCSLNFAHRGAPAFLVSLGAAGLIYLLAIREFFSTPQLPTRTVVIGIALAALGRFLFLALPVGVDDDIHRYVWDGRLQRLGYNPYIVIPSDPAVSRLHTPETRGLNNAELPSPYPAGAQLFFRVVTAIHESTVAMKVAFVVCDFAVIFVLFDLLRRDGQGEHWVLAYAWNPLLAVEVAGSGHVDIVGVLLLLISFAALNLRTRTIAAVTFALAVSVKLLPIVLMPLYWRRVRIRDAALAAVVFGSLYLPFLNHGRIPIGSLGAYVQSFRFNDPVFAELERSLTPKSVAVIALFVGFLTAAGLRSTSARSSSATFVWPLAASLLCAPVVYPWYLLWLLPFVRSAPTVPLIVWTVSIIPTYIVWHLRTLGRPWLVPNWVMLLEYGFVATASLIVLVHGMARPAMSGCSLDGA